MHEKYLVVGLGITGFSAMEYLSKQAVQITVTDSRVEPPKFAELRAAYPRVSTLLGKISVPADTTTIILSPGVSIDEPDLQAAQAKGIPIIGDIELFARVVDKPVIAVTGSNGKSTVTTLLGKMAQACGIKAGIGGNLGIPALSLLAPNNVCYILELSSFQLETLYSLRPLVVTILNITPDHMERYADMLPYQQAKQRIYHNARYAVFNRADPLTKPNSTIEENCIVSFGLDQPTVGNYGVVTSGDKRWLAKGDTLLIAIEELALLGEHNVANALAALAMGEIAGFDLDAMLLTLKTFTGLEHACEKVLRDQDILWVNDSKGTNPAATIAGLQGLSQSINGKWIIILGGLSKNADFAPLLAPVQKYCKAAILIGSAADELYDLLHASVVCKKAKNLSEVVKIAKELAAPGDGVLLSPACASQDMFENYAHRGREFKELVQQGIGVQHERSAN